MMAKNRTGTGTYDITKIMLNTKEILSKQCNGFVLMRYNDDSHHCILQFSLVYHGLSTLGIVRVASKNPEPERIPPPPYKIVDAHSPNGSPKKRQTDLHNVLHLQAGI